AARPSEVAAVLAHSFCASLLGVEGVPVRVEVEVAFGLPSLTIVGLAGSQVQEARERVRSALRNSGFEVPARRITVNLSPPNPTRPGGCAAMSPPAGHRSRRSARALCWARMIRWRDAERGPCRGRGVHRPRA
ncbi:MAG TPA: magnesium chelatase domain-containing protein, partial [Nitriliruptorales bacterium]